jgi:hypothetical protein
MDDSGWAYGIVALEAERFDYGVCDFFNAHFFVFAD